MIKIVRMFSDRLAFWLLVRKWERDHKRPLYSFSEILPAGRKAGFTAIELRKQYVQRKARRERMVYVMDGMGYVYATKRGGYDY